MDEEKFLNAVDDGLIIRNVGRWTKDKLHKINLYLCMFLNSMRKKPWRSINYIDLFSGPGKCRIKESNEILLGSPLLALTLKNSFDKYFFADKEIANINDLKKRSKSSSDFEKIDFFQDDANKRVKDIVENILEQDKTPISGKWSSLNLAILDPEGLELNWQTVSTLAKVYKMDLIIYYSQMGITRSAPKEIESPNICAIDRFFGGKEWRDIYKNSEKAFLHRNLIDHYKSNLKKLGFCEIETYEPREINSKNSPLYRLIHASKHEFAVKLWNESVKKDVYGQKSLF